MANEQDIDIGFDGGDSVPLPESVPGSVKGSTNLNSVVPDISNQFDPTWTTDQFLHKLLDVQESSLIPWESFELPSRGIYYNWPDGLIQVRPMGQKAEKAMANQRLAQNGQNIDAMFSLCCRFPDDFEPTDLLLGDRAYLLFVIRGITHGNIHEFLATCPNEACGRQTNHTYDLNELHRTTRWADQSLGQEPFKIVLPYLSEATKREVWVTVRFLRARDTAYITARRRTKKQLVSPGHSVRNRNDAADPAKLDIDDLMDSNLERTITSVMGVESPNQIRSMISRLTSPDLAAIREFMREKSPGIDNTVAVTCPACEVESVIELPLTDSFFRPARPRESS